MALGGAVATSCLEWTPICCGSCSKLPSWARAVTPRIFYITEKAWNYYPYTITGEPGQGEGTGILRHPTPLHQWPLGARRAQLIAYSHCPVSPLPLSPMVPPPMMLMCHGCPCRVHSKEMAWGDLALSPAPGMAGEWGTGGSIPPGMGVPGISSFRGGVSLKVGLPWGEYPWVGIS